MSLQLEVKSRPGYDNRSSSIPQGLNNCYVVWRHGESEANKAGIIVSHPENGVKSFGLTSAGRNQVRAEVLHAALSGLVDNDVLLYCSPFLRCVETAEEIAYCLGINEINVRNELQERNFGELEGRPKPYYQTVYALDRIHPEHRSFGVEGVGDVLARVTGLVRELEYTHIARTIVLVTHADVGEILQTAFMGLQPQEHRNLPKLRNAEPRELRFMYA